MPGTFTITNGEKTVITTEDMTQYMQRGDNVNIGGATYVIDAQQTFDSTHLPLATNYTGITQVSGKAYRQEVSVNLHYTTSAADMEIALENLPTIGRVQVSHDMSASGHHIWNVTYLSLEGEQYLLNPNYHNMPSGSIVEAARVTLAIKPPNYSYKILTVKVGHKYTIGSLVRGNFYHARLFLDDRGMGSSLNSVPQSAPLQHQACLLM